MNLHLIGKGSLLSRGAIAASRIFPEGYIHVLNLDREVSFKRNSIVEAVEHQTANEYLQKLLGTDVNHKVFLLNCEEIILDQNLTSGLDVYNIHAADTAQFRGLSEICVLWASISRVQRYGVTLYKLEPGRAVDEGRVVKRLFWEIHQDMKFCDLMIKAQDNCLQIFLENLEELCLNQVSYYELDYSQSRLLSYSDLEELKQLAKNENRIEFLDLGVCGFLFPRLFQKLLG
jgi:hypothetical protein